MPVGPDHGSGKQQRLTKDAEARLLEEAVKKRIHSLSFPEPEEPKTKREVEYLYIDADEDHVLLQLHVL